MGLDFDVLEFCRELRNSKQPPYNCPVQDCGKTYKSMCGLQYHLVNYDHSDKPSTSGTWSQSKEKASEQVSAKKRSSKSPVSKKSKLQKDYTTKDETKLEIEIDDKTYYIGIDEPISLVSKQNYDLMYPSTSGGFSDSKRKKETLPNKFPEPTFSIIPDYHISKAPPKPLGYIRYIERNNDDLDAEVEYDIDEEDSAWLDIVNKGRRSKNLDTISVDVFELLMDRLEKESFFQMSASKEVQPLIDDDAICCICMDGECQNSNVILFCDMCNLAVHQDCYGVPYIPEGQWLCRRCLNSPSRAVDCVLCPNNGGAFKQTDRGHWAHVVCALWIPEVRFANTVFLEPIDCIETIPAARWKLTCYLCKQRGVGACIQCYKTSCYAAFHVTCAQMKGLYMKMDAIEDSSSDRSEDDPVIVQKIAYCNTHTPHDAGVRPKINYPSQPCQSTSQSAPPLILLPTIPPDKIQEIKGLFSVSKKNQFLQRLIAYWTLKRQLRNGVPLLRRLQHTQQSTRRPETTTNESQSQDIHELKKQLKYWQSLRQDLERARLLCELVRKREKLKKELVKMKEQCLELQLCPLVGFLRKLVEMLRSRDTGEIFIEPVDLVEVPDYADIVKHPMDLSTMRHKVDTFQYNNLKEFEEDFNLMINNCLAYNSKDTVFYRAALKMREQGGAILKQAQKELETVGLPNVNGGFEEDIPSPGTSSSPQPTNETTAADIDLQIQYLSDPSSNLTPDERIEKLQLLLDECSKLKNAISRCRKSKHINKIISSIKRKKTNEHHRSKRRDKKKSKKSSMKKQLIKGCEVDSADNVPYAHDMPSTSTDYTMTEAGPSTPVKATGVNRRTAVLFTRKAAAAMKSSPSSPQSQAEDSSSLPATAHRRRGKQKYSLPFNFGHSSVNSDSFKTYRTDGTKDRVKTDDSNSDAETSCSGCSSSGVQCGSTSRSSSDWSDSESDANKDNSPMEALDQLQLVWAKCRGYPWYPALIINPKMPPGYMHNGVPIPVPPEDVIALANNYTEPVYLVLFFDTKRTWQWLPRNKLEPLGITYELDYLKLTESRKPADRKAVKKAYHEAMKYRTQIDKNMDPAPTSDSNA